MTPEPPEFYRYHLLGLIPLGPPAQFSGQRLLLPWRLLGRMRPTRTGPVAP